jgi:hypothetical protein
LLLEIKLSLKKARIEFDTWFSRAKTSRKGEAGEGFKVFRIKRIA